MQQDDRGLIDGIYEAAIVPDQWPEILRRLGEIFNAAGALFFTSSLDGVRWIAAPSAEWIVEDYIAGGWMDSNMRGAPMIQELHPGFRTDSDYRTAEQRAALPVYRDFLLPRGIDAAAGTVIQGAGHDAIVLTVEGFPSHEASRAAIPLLDRLRPHLARAMTISARIKDHEALATVNGLAAMRTAAAIVDESGRLRAANGLFNERLGNALTERSGRLHFVGGDIDRRYASILAAYGRGSVAAQSVVLKPSQDEMPVVLHVMPLRGYSSDMFNARGLLLVLAEGDNINIPGSDLLRMLFDLTPAEARLTRRLLAGDTLTEAALALSVKEGTVRSQLKAIFAKTGFNRQADLVRVLLGYAQKPAI